MSFGHTVRCLTTGMPVLLTGGQPGCRAGDERLSYYKFNAPESIAVTSGAFGDGDVIPTKYSQDGRNISPPITWHGIPSGTRSILLVVEDPDAPTPNPFLHWLAYNIPPSHTGIGEGYILADKANDGCPFAEGRNSSLKIGYVGAAPPKGDTPHHYHFQVYALDMLLDVEAGGGRSRILSDAEGHVLAKGRLIGTFAR